MAVLVAAVVLAICIGLLNLLLTYGVIRRLREQSHPATPEPELPIGRKIEVAEIRTTDGSTLPLPAPGVVAFFSPGCPPCEELLPGFIEAAANLPDGRERVVAVLADTDDPGSYLERLAPVAQVVAGQPGKDLATALQVVGVPILCQLDADATLVWAGTDLSKLAPAQV